MISRREKALKLRGARISLGSLLSTFPLLIGTTWVLVLGETALLAFVPLMIGFAIDGLLAGSNGPLLWLVLLLAGLIILGIGRRLYDTRAYGTVRVEIGAAMAEKSKAEDVSIVNARLSMGRELADFLEEQAPQLLTAVVQLAVSLLILWAFHPMLLVTALVAGGAALSIYAVVHKKFFALNGQLNEQAEKQVNVLQRRSQFRLWHHLVSLRKIEVKLSDTEAFVYGAIFFVLLAFITFNLWFAAGNVEPTVGTIFSIVSYSWEFVEAVLVLPLTLQGWTRLSEITERINAVSDGHDALPQSYST